MTSQIQIDNVKVYLVISSNNMSKISTPNAPPNYTPLQTFRDVINENSIVVPAPNTEVGHTALTMKKTHFNTANSGTYTDLISPGDRPSKPTTTGIFTTSVKASNVI